MARWWFPSLLVIDRTSAMSFMTLAVWPQPSAIEMRGNGRRDGLGLAAVLGAGLGVERFELAGAAGHPEQDARHLALAQIGGVECHPIREADGDRRRDGQAGRPQGERLEEVPAVDHARRRSSPPAPFLFRVP